MWMPIVVLLLAGAFFVLGGRALRRKRLLENVPTSRVAGVFLGLTEVKGKAGMRHPLVSYLAEIRCVYYAYTIEEKWERTVTETYTDAEGRTKTRTRTESGWQTVAEGGKAPAFFIRDDTGALRVLPAGARIEARPVFSETATPAAPFYHGKGPAGAIPDSVHVRSFTERAIPVGQDLYVLGTARLRKDGVTPEIRHARGDRMFLISVKPEETLVRRYGLSSAVLLAVSLVLALLGAALLQPDGGPYAGFRDWLQGHRGALLPAAAVYLALLAAWYGVLIYNGLVFVRNRVKNAWSQIDIQLRRRFNLIPRLAALARAYAAHEAALFEEVARHRAPSPGAADPQAAATEAERQTRDLGGLLALGERYPELRSDEQFLSLERRIARTEDRLALARAFYNESVTVYNDRLATFPDLLVARVAGFRPRPLMHFGDLKEAPALGGAFRSTAPF